MNKYENERAEFKEIVDLIEELNNSNTSDDEIMKGVMNALPITFDSVYHKWGLLMPVTLKKYILRRKLTIGLETYIQEKPKLRKTDEYYGVRAFRDKFKREFGEEPSEDGLFELQRKLDVDEALEIRSSLLFLDIADARRIEGPCPKEDYVKVISSLITYVIPKIFYVMSCGLDHGMKIPSLYNATYMLFENGKPLPVECAIKEKGITSLERLYHLDEYEQIERDLLVVAPYMDERLFPIFRNNFDKWFSWIITTMPLKFIDTNTAKELCVLSDSYFPEEAEDKLHLTREALVKKTFEYLRRGYLRLLRF